MNKVAEAVTAHRPRRPSPLVELLRSLSIHERLAIRQVSLGPSLGYTTSIRFSNAELLLRYLDPPRPITPHPDDMLKLRFFKGPVTLELLLQHATRVDAMPRWAFDQHSQVNNDP